MKLFLSIISLSITCGFVGSFLLWKRLTFFSDSLSHASFFGIMLAIILSKSQFLGTFLVGIVFVVALNSTSKTNFPKELWLAILSSLGLSLGIVLDQIFPQANSLDILAGDLMSVNNLDVSLMILSSLLIASLSLLKFKEIILIIMNEDLAIAEGINVRAIKMLLLLFIMFGIITSLKATGSLMTPGLFTLMPTIALGSSCMKKIISTIILTVIHISLGIFLNSFLNVSLCPVVIIIGFLTLIGRIIFFSK